MNWQAPLTEYIATQLPSADNVEIVRAMGMAAGASNDTVGLDVKVTCDGFEHTLPLVLRPQRQDGILAPYDVARQFRVMRALQPTDVPVPAVFWLDTTGDVLGTPFFVMSRVEGDTLPLFWYGGQTPRLAACAAALATVHAVDWRGAGLEFLVPDGAETPVESELVAWRQRAESVGLHQHSLIVALGGWLTANEPPDARFCLLHGDPNPGNYLLAGDIVAAVVDWEVAAIGDPRSDLGFYSALLTVFGAWGGLDSNTVLSQAYSEAVGQPLTDLNYYEALGLYKMAIVLSGMSRRGGGWGFFGLDTIVQRLDAMLGPQWAG